MKPPKTAPVRPPDRLYVTAKAAVWSGDRLLLLCEDDGDGVELYDLPGGRLDTGEAVADGLARELREELGVAIAWRSTLPIKVWSTVSRDGVGVVALLFEVVLAASEFDHAGAPEVLGARYLTLQELEALPGAVHKPFIAEYFRERTARR